MSKKKRPSRLQRNINFFRYISQGEMAILDRIKSITGNLVNRDWRRGCCGNYGAPGC